MCDGPAGRRTGAIRFRVTALRRRAGGGPQPAHPALLTDDLETLRARLAAGGASIVEDRQMPGYRRFYTEDPFGNRIELLQPD